MGKLLKPLSYNALRVKATTSTASSTHLHPLCAKLLYRLCLREPAGADGRVREHHRGHIVVVCFRVFKTAKQSVRNRHSVT
jgi:hypothetical protein